MKYAHINNNIGIFLQVTLGYSGIAKEEVDIPLVLCFLIRNCDCIACAVWSYHGLEGDVGYTPFRLLFC